MDGAAHLFLRIALTGVKVGTDLAPINRDVFGHPQALVRVDVDPRDVALDLVTDGSQRQLRAAVVKRKAEEVLSKGTTFPQAIEKGLILLAKSHDAWVRHACDTYVATFCLGIEDILVALADGDIGDGLEVRDLQIVQPDCRFWRGESGQQSEQHRCQVARTHPRQLPLYRQCTHC